MTNETKQKSEQIKSDLLKYINLNSNDQKQQRRIQATLNSGLNPSPNFKSKIPGNLVSIGTSGNGAINSANPGIWTQLQPGYNQLSYTGTLQSGNSSNLSYISPKLGPGSWIPYSQSQSEYSGYDNDNDKDNRDIATDLLCSLFTGEDMKNYLESLEGHVVITHTSSTRTKCGVYYSLDGSESAFLGDLDEVFVKKMKTKLINLLLSKQVLKMKI